MSDERRETEGEVIEPSLVRGVLGLVGEDDHGCGRVDRAREEEQGEECADWEGHDEFGKIEMELNRKNASRWLGGGGL